MARISIVHLQMYTYISCHHYQDVDPSIRVTTDDQVTMDIHGSTVVGQVSWDIHGCSLDGYSW